MLREADQWPNLQLVSITDPPFKSIANGGRHRLVVWFLLFPWTCLHMPSGYHEAKQTRPQIYFSVGSSSVQENIQAGPPQTFTSVVQKWSVSSFSWLCLNVKRGQRLILNWSKLHVSYCSCQGLLGLSSRPNLHKSGAIAVYRTVSLTLTKGCSKFSPL